MKISQRLVGEVLEKEFWTKSHPVLRIFGIVA